MHDQARVHPVASEALEPGNYLPPRDLPRSKNMGSAAARAHGANILVGDTDEDEWRISGRPGV